MRLHNLPMTSISPHIEMLENAWMLICSSGSYRYFLRQIPLALSIIDVKRIKFIVMAPLENYNRASVNSLPCQFKASSFQVLSLY